MKRYECDSCHKVVDENGVWWRCGKYVYIMHDLSLLFITPQRCYCHNCNEYTEAQIGIKGYHLYKRIIELGKSYSFIDVLFKTKKYRSAREQIDELYQVSVRIKEKGETNTACIKCGSNNVELIADSESLQGRQCSCGKGRLASINEDDDSTRIVYSKPEPVIIKPQMSHRIQQAHEKSLVQEEEIYKYIQYIKGKD